MRSVTLLLVLFLLKQINSKAQDTFSILAFDSITREIGAAGASCVDLYNFPGYSNDFICELMPDSGAIATQASYMPSNQYNARLRMVAGDSPSQIIAWLNANDVNANSSIRQYGVVALDRGYPRAAAFTGTNCMNYKNHIVGPNYTIHGNILLGQKVLDSIESGFKRTKGDLACKLMGAIKGANMVGADSRCAPNNSSSLFAFIKVTQPTDTFGKPSFLLSLKTHSNALIEPLDSLEKMFYRARNCQVNSAGIPKINMSNGTFVLVPNPAIEQVSIYAAGAFYNSQVLVYDVYGREIFKFEIDRIYRLDVSKWKKGIYFVELVNAGGRSKKKLVVN
ncbi:MAG: DUF1028 domain-containing protein [Bacteroidia bacterium]|nr:DUF1028 domain-containing protein [Bacteroidia bacterium]